jgi:hypothetical protein
MEYIQAELQMREGQKVARKAWPTGRSAFHDVEGDGIPDHAKPIPVKFYPQMQQEYELFLRNIRISENGQIVPGAYITQEDSLANDWIVVE